MTAVEEYNALNGQTVDREEIKRVAILGAGQQQGFIHKKLMAILEAYPEEESFYINIGKRAVDVLPKDCLPGMECKEPDEEDPGLGKAVSPNEIYQYITDLIINTIDKVGDLPWQREWKKTALYNGFQAMNFESKKGYRGINFVLLNFEVKEIDGEPTLVPKNWENPYFLTFNQIEKNKGELKKGSKGKRVIYFTQLYTHTERNKDGSTAFEFSTYNKKKFAAWAKKNQDKISRIKSGERSLERFVDSSYLPILKYYNVFNGEDITGIKWGELPKNENTEKSEAERLEVGEKIIEKYPNPPKIIYKGDQPAYYPKQDQILMTPIDAFKNPQSYYSTLFHECIHSTGHSKRLKRGNDTRTRDNSEASKKAYAFEELTAELGAVFLCAESGVLFSTIDNSAKYLKGWNSRLVKQMKDDNRFFFRASSRSQAAADYILDRDKNGVPAYQNSFISESKKKVKPKKEMPVKTKRKAANTVGGPPKSTKNTKKKNTNQLLEEQKKAKITAKNKTEFEKQLRKLGFDIISYESNQVSPKEWQRTYKMNYKAVTGVKLEMEVKPDGKIVEGEYSWKAIGLDAQSSIDYKNFQEFYEEILKDFQWVFGEASITEMEDLKKEYSKTLYKKKEPKAQLGLFGAYPSKPTLKETLKFAEDNLIGNSFFVDAIGEKVHFTKPKLKKAMTNPRASKENLALVYKLPKMLKKAVLLSEQPDKRKRKEIKKVFKLVLIEKLFGEVYRVLITIRKQDKNYYYDHAVIETIKPEKQDGSVNNVNPIPLDVASTVPDKDTKKPHSKPKKASNEARRVSQKRDKKDTKKSNKKNNGLKAPVYEPVENTITTAIVEETPVQTIPQPISVKEPEKIPETKPTETTKAKSLVSAMQEIQNNEVFDIPGDMGRFLGQVEKKPVHSVVTTLDAEQGSGKTRFFFQAMNVLAGMGLKCLFYSLEEHPQSKLFKDKVNQYISPENLVNISVIDEVQNWNAQKSVIMDSDAIFIDSFQKLPAIDLDADIRKAFNGKWFWLIYQQNGAKGMRGGSKAAFDGDQILKIAKHDDYKENYVFSNKNRYNEEPNLKYNIYSQKLQGENIPDPEVKVENSTSSREPAPEYNGRLIATPIS